MTAAPTPATVQTVEGRVTALKETSRTYIFPGDERVRFENVVELLLRPTGSHRLKTADGKLHAIAKGWLAITIEDESRDWTV